MTHVDAPGVEETESSHRLGSSERFTVVVIGGGINGIAVFRDLCLQGVDTLLVERGDYSSGASAASSHMVHGGLRYLENGELRLVQESVAERNSLLYTAPHHVQPLPTTIPLRKTWAGIAAAPMRVLRHRPSTAGTERGAVLAKVGLTMYDSYSRRSGSLPRHRFSGPKRSRSQFPDLAADVRYTATYYDAVVRQPERVAIDLINDGLAANPQSRAVNYMEATGLGADGIELTDHLSGERTTIQAGVVINASGPWTDLTNTALGDPSDFMGGTKGSHIVVDNPELLAATQGHEIFFEHPDGRIVLIHPLHDRVMIGTTDLPADPAKPVRCTEQEVEYFIDLVAVVFPDIPVLREQIVYRFAGIRPLPKLEDAVPGVISRDYRIETRTDPQGRLVLSIVGGKWTTFRALAERVTNEVIGHLGVPRNRHTFRELIGGAKRYPRDAQARRAWVAERLDRVDRDRGQLLLARYGTHAEQVHDYVCAGGDEPIAGIALSTREVAYMVNQEHARTISDILKRRTTLAFEGRLTRAVVDKTARAMQDALGWTEDHREREVQLCLTDLADGHGVHL